MSAASPPSGYQRFVERGAQVVARADVADAILAAYRAAPRNDPTLHGYARQVDGARPFQGRELAYGIELPGLEKRVVVRHNRHGGALRALTGDLFLGSTRAPRELEIALALHELKIPTPAVVAYATYPAGLGFARSDVVTEEITESADLGKLLLLTTEGSAERLRVWGSVSHLLAQLAAAGVRHHDLNVKNILIRRVAGEEFVAYALDVDRVEFDCTRRDANAGNRARLIRSMEKWQRTQGAAITGEEIASLRLPMSP